MNIPHLKNVSITVDASTTESLLLEPAKLAASSMSTFVHNTILVGVVAFLAMIMMIFIAKIW